MGRINCVPADLISDGIDHLRNELKGTAESDENVLTCAVFPKITLDFFKNRKERN
jgi:oxaloacetate decarboxylase alpha subunit